MKDPFGEKMEDLMVDLDLLDIQKDIQSDLVAWWEIIGLIQKEWNLQYFESPSYIWESKLRSVWSSLKRWVKAGFKNPSHHKIKLQNDLATLQSHMKVDEVTPAFLSQAKELSMKFLNVARQEQEVWRLKSK